MPHLILPPPNLSKKKEAIQAGKWITIWWMCVLSRVRLFASPGTVAYQAPLCVGLSRQESCSELPFPSPGDLPNPGMEPITSCVSCMGRWVLYHCATREAHLIESLPSVELPDIYSTPYLILIHWCALSYENTPNLHYKKASGWSFQHLFKLWMSLNSRQY